MQNLRPPEPTKPQQITFEHPKAAEKKNKWDRLAPPSYSPSLPPPDAPEATVVRPKSEKLPEEVAVGAPRRDSKSEIQESAGGEGDMVTMTYSKTGNDTSTRRNRKEKKRGESRAPCTSQQPLPGSTHHHSC